MGCVSLESINSFQNFNLFPYIYGEFIIRIKLSHGDAEWHISYHERAKIGSPFLLYEVDNSQTAWAFLFSELPGRGK